MLVQSIGLKLAYLVFGDCEDYALLKRKFLLNSGFERKDLHLACCWCENDEYHCVLLVNTDKRLVYIR